MIKRMVVLCVLFLTALAWGQTAGTTDRLERMPKKFPPELAAPQGDAHRAALSRRYCVSPAPEKNSLSIKPCQTAPRRFRLAPSLDRKSNPKARQ